MKKATGNKGEKTETYFSHIESKDELLNEHEPNISDGAPQAACEPVSEKI